MLKILQVKFKYITYNKNNFIIKYIINIIIYKNLEIYKIIIIIIKKYFNL